ncbi:type I restriction enzyme S subunit [Methanocalculus alkaliphilus]|uniref:restriction endonuclease subunit S n=1 Tax=Methanocalculus alkaliphilus TaxID=768730 RepID=UPI00209D8782|nr:restriction endonuclease subunit S [Methanocalculus alkaliphilus]MCP1715858.1 type I restriction enzyme S subunit [Methanocalculus alkaliphilus]
MTEQGAVPSGYKRTEIGVIPEDWKIHPLGDLFSLKNGFAFSSKYFSYSGPIILTPGNFRLDGGLYFEERNTKRFSGVYSSEMIFRVGDLLIVMTDLTPGCNLLGKPAFILSEEIILHNQRIGKVIIKNKGLVKSYLFYFLLSRLYLDVIKERAIGTTVRHTSNKSIYSVLIPTPPLPEQHAIAAALSDVDGLIGALDALITKKRDMKQAAMQQLLTGRTRLPGFEGEWVTVKVGAIGTFSKGRGIKRDDVSDNGLACIRYGELYTTYKNYITSPVSRISPSVASDALPIKTGDLLFAGSGETAEDIGQCAAYLGTEQAYAGGDIIVLNPEGQNSIYLGHLMNHESVTMQKARMAQGDAIVHISTRSLSQIEVELPSIDEQLAISKLLLDMDAEIAALERRRDKSKEIKQGMMQQLLTGKVRLVAPEEIGDHNNMVQA